MTTTPPRGLLDIDSAAKRLAVPERFIEVDISVVPSVADVIDLIEHIANGSEGGRRYAAFFACIGLAGMRPSEVAALKVADLDLPIDGWGLARLRGAVTTPGTRYSGNGAVNQPKALKHRGVSDIREVPLPVGLVDRLRDHLADFPSDDFVFRNNAGNIVSAHNYGKVWRKARRRLWPSPHPLSNAVTYDLRHSAATTMLTAGVNPAEAARRLGHSVDMLLRVYAGVMDGERERANELLSRPYDVRSRHC